MIRYIRNGETEPDKELTGWGAGRLSVNLVGSGLDYQESPVTPISDVAVMWGDPDSRKLMATKILARDPSYPEPPNIVDHSASFLGGRARGCGIIRASWIYLVGRDDYCVPR